jgi:SAM-dependent methyltransferase
MSRFGQQLLLTLNRLAPPANKALLEAKRDSLAYMRFFEQRTITSFEPFGRMALRDKTVLDLGCGLGGNLAFIHQQQPRHVTALDILFDQIQPTERAFAEHYPAFYQRTHFITGDAAAMPFAAARFDAVVSTDTFEHIDDLAGALGECMRILRPGGLAYIYFPPFYAPWGAHMVNWLNLPWPQVFFSEETVLEAARRLEREEEAVNCGLPDETRLDLGAGKTIPFVSHLTVGKFLEAVRRTPQCRIRERKLLPPGWRGNSLASRLLRPLARAPWVREMFTAKAVFILERIL